MAQLPESVYGVFCGTVEQVSAQKLVKRPSDSDGLGSEACSSSLPVERGYVGDGVFLHNFFRSVPIELTLYNAGQISSIAVIAYLGAKSRKATKSSTFMLHRSTNSPQFTTASSLQHAAASLILDDQRTEDIIKSHASFPPEIWDQINRHDVYFSAEDAVKFKIADEIADFALLGFMYSTALLSRCQ